MPEMLGITFSKDPVDTTYNADYFERGIETGTSLYQNYRWMPELTIPMAMTIVDFLRLERSHRILDFGCAKGYLVKALRLLYRQAWGVDISRYAIENVDPSVKDFCVLKEDWWDPDKRTQIPAFFDYCIAKDVFEHLDVLGLTQELSVIPAEMIFAVIPLGENGEYRARANNYDVSHRICADQDWWMEFFQDLSFELVEFRLKIPGIKDHYYERYPDSHGFFLLRRKIR